MSTTPIQADPNQALRRQMAQFFDATTDAILFLDRQYRFTFINRRAQEVLGPADTLLGRDMYEVFPAAANKEAPFVENYRRSMEQGETSEFEAYYPEPLNLWFRIQSYPADNGMIIFFRDISDEKRSREELSRKREEAERQHAEIETVYRTAPIGLALFDTKDYRYLRLNERQAAFFGLKPEQIVGRTLTEMAPIEGLKELFDQVMHGEPVINYPLEGTLVTDPEDYRYWTVSYFPVYGADGSIQAITAASLEITEQKKAQQALIESEKLAVVGRLASSIAHEINNPLEAVTNLLYLAHNGEDLEAVRRYVEMAEIELRRIAAITSQTLRFHKQASSPQAISPEQLLQTAVSIFQGRLANSSVIVEKRERANVQVRCFEGEIRQVLSNLIGNAIDAMSAESGRLILRTRVGRNRRNGEQGVWITVADTGSGMSPATRAKLFRPFFTTKGHTGTGLGLWLSKEIMDRHRGVLLAHSSQDPKHRGTVFSVFLPFDAVTR